MDESSSHWWTLLVFTRLIAEFIDEMSIGKIIRSIIELK